MFMFLGLGNMVEATPIMGWGGVGMLTFLQHAHMLLHSCLKLRNAAVG